MKIHTHTDLASTAVSRTRYRVVLSLLGIALVAIVVGAVILTPSGDAPRLPSAVDSYAPVDGATVLRQTQVVIDLNSIFGFDAPVASYSWRLLGRREMLGPINVRNYPAKWCEGDASFAPCDVWQKRKAWIVEATSRLPYDAYSKRIIAIDDEAWLVLASDLFDGNAELWKTVFNFWRKMPVPDGRGGAEDLMLILAGSAVDLQARRALRWRFPLDIDEPIVRVNTGLEPIDFSVGRMSGAFR